MWEHQDFNVLSGYKSENLKVNSKAERDIITWLSSMHGTPN